MTPRPRMLFSPHREPVARESVQCDMDDSALRTFGPFELDLSTGQLQRRGVPVPLQRQPARVLAALVERAGDLVSRVELRAAVWDDATHVDFDRGLNYCIRHLRAALGDDARQPRFIETVARQGYRFVESVAVGQRRSRAISRRRSVAPAAAALTAILLLTLAVESGGRNQQHHDAAVALARAVHDFIF